MALYSWYLNNSKGSKSKIKQVVRCSNWPIATVENKKSNTFKATPLVQDRNSEIFTATLSHYKIWQKVSFEK